MTKVCVLHSARLVPRLATNGLASDPQRAWTVVGLCGPQFTVPVVHNQRNRRKPSDCLRFVAKIHTDIRRSNLLAPIISWYHTSLQSGTRKICRLGACVAWGVATPTAVGDVWCPVVLVPQFRAFRHDAVPRGRIFTPPPPRAFAEKRAQW